MSNEIQAIRIADKGLSLRKMFTKFCYRTDRKSKIRRVNFIIGANNKKVSETNYIIITQFLPKMMGEKYESS